MTKNYKPVSAAKRSLGQKLNLFTVIFADTKISSTTKVVAAWLLFYHHNTVTDLCFPSNRTVGLAIGLTPENVSRHIRKLVKAGYLSVRPRFGTSNSYRFNWACGSREAVNAVRTRLRKASPDLQDFDQPAPPDMMSMMEMAEGDDDGVVGSCRNQQGSYVENDNLTLEEKTVIEDGNLTLRQGEKDNPPSGSFTKNGQLPEDHFDQILDVFVPQFRSIYPLEIFETEISSIRAAARRALALADAEVILDGAMRYHAECSGREARFIADPVNWLNGRKWSGKGKIKSNAVILTADGNPIPAYHQGTIRDRIQNWQPPRQSLIPALSHKTEKK